MEELEKTEALEKAREELKRADHQIYVSLKYVRTVDVIRNIVQRLDGAIDFGMLALLKKAKDEKKIKDIPENPVQKAEKVTKLYEDNPQIKEAIELYSLLRKIMRSEFVSKKEYRRNVTMMVKIENKTHFIDIDTIEAYYKKVNEFYSIVRTIIYDIKEE
ncbi:MAG: hypothetical protein Q8O89_00135 [Nanoarchaeota archaeon]|nr:hypothetical protein [Nanoarchaeota archaeon]